MQKTLYPQHPVHCIITGPSCSGKSVFLTNKVLHVINEYDKVYIHSPSLYQDSYQKKIKCFTNYILINITQNYPNEKFIDTVTNEIGIKKDFEKSDIELETYESIEEIKLPQEYNDGGVIILDDLNGKEMKNPRVQAMIKRSRHNKISIFFISHNYHELPKRTMRANGNIYHIFKPNIFRDVQNLSSQSKNGYDPQRSHVINIHFLD